MILLNDFLLTRNGFRIQFRNNKGKLLLRSQTATDVSSRRLIQEPVDYVGPEDEMIEIPMEIVKRIFGE